jgi:fibronectin-binding autotransporter adhesin
MKTLKLKQLLVVGLAAAATAGIGSARAASTLTVCPSGCAFTQVAAAVAAAKDGDTISIAPGTYAGGFTVDVSVKLVGAGAGRTVISGGGPVMTIGTFGASSEPTVSIDGVTITGGVTRSSPESAPCTGKDGAWAAGGGIEVPPSTYHFGGDGVCDADRFGGGATVTITNSVITGNLVAPSDTVSGIFPIPAAWAFGGGIDTSGSLTLANTTVSDNRIGSASGLSGLATFARGAGIFGGIGDMTITNGTISGNQAAVTGHGVWAEGAGLISNGTFSMSNSSVTDNSATVSADFFGFVPVAGLHVQGHAQGASISNSTISGNTATVQSSGPFTSGAQGGGVKLDLDDSNVRLSNDTISDNSVSVTTLPGSTADAFGWGGAGEIGGTLSNVRITGNSLDVSSAAGNAQALGGASPFDGGTISNSLIANNHVHVSAPLGSVDISGGGLDVFGPTTLRNSTVSGNTVDASGASGSARGGGIADIAFPLGSDGPPGGPLTLQNSSVTGNTLTGTAGLTLQGGGVYLQNEPITLTNSLISGNVPDQCFGC